jgi:hypothetical protein
MALPNYKFLARLSGLASLVLSTHSVGAVEGGVFCIRAGSYFVERPEPNGALTFDVLESNAQGNVIEIKGVAVPHKGGWRYQVKSDSDPQQRCTLDITPVAGGFKMDTVKGATCAGMGGFNAEIALMGASFPASTRVKDMAPIVDGTGKIPGFDCALKKFETAQGGTPVKTEKPGSNEASGRLTAGASTDVTVASHPQERTPPAVPAADTSDPVEVVSAVVKLDSAGEGRPFGSDEFIRHYFTTQFKSSWDHAMAQPEDVLDGDPVTGSQALKSVKLEATQITTKTPDSAVVVAKLAVTPRGGRPYPQSVIFTVNRDGSAWKIDDISGPVDGSLRGYFKKSYGQ